MLAGTALTWGAGGGLTILIVNEDQDPILAQTELLSTAMYFVRTVWALIRFKSETLMPFRMKHEALPALAVFFEGFEMIGMGFEPMTAVGIVVFLFKKTCKPSLKRLELSEPVPVTCRLRNEHRSESSKEQSCSIRFSALGS